MSTIVTRAAKGSPLTHNEVDANFTNLNTDKYQSGDTVTFASAVVTGAATLNGTSIPNNKTLLVSTDIGVSVQGYDADLAAFAAKTAPTGDVVGTSDSQTLTNKTIALGNNTVSGTLAQFNTAVTDADLVSIAGSETLTNKTLTSPAINTATISGGTINNATVGATTAASGKFTTLEATGFNAGSSFGFKNRIINGAMVFDQRNAGASVTINTGAVNYTLDRWFGFGQPTDGVFTIQRSTTAPAGFVNSLLATVTTADASIGASQTYSVVQYIEGFNTTDLGWGTANAKTVTLSFWVRSSVTGTFGGSIRNNAANRSYPFSYSISSANTFEYKTITIAGDTSGTWATDNTSGLQVWFSLGTGSTLSGTAGAWAGSNLTGATGATALMSSLNATWYITGVQLEVGSIATSFDYRPYTTELQLCHRYYYKIKASNSLAYFGVGTVSSATGGEIFTSFPVSMRTAPTALEQSGTAGQYQVISGISGLTCSAVPTFGIGDIWGATTTFTVASGGNNGYAALLRALLSTNAFLAWSAELT